MLPFREVDVIVREGVIKVIEKESGFVLFVVEDHPENKDSTLHHRVKRSRKTFNYRLSLAIKIADVLNERIKDEDHLKKLIDSAIKEIDKLINTIKKS